MDIQLYHLVVIAFCLYIVIRLLFHFFFRAPNSLWTKTQPKLFKKQHLESIHSKDHSWQGQLNLSDLLQKSRVKVWKCDLSRKERFRLFSIFWLILCFLASKDSAKPHFFFVHLTLYEQKHNRKYSKNTILRVFIAKIIHDKVNGICQICYKKVA